MSVTVSDILKLPSLRNAKVLAGHKGLDKTVSAVSVLEYSNVNEMQERLLSQIDFTGNDLVITAFASAMNNVDDQCYNLRILSSVGVPAVILYYVGILMDKVDRRLLQVANELDLVLICMPEGKASLRYSEVISEVMELIVLDRMTDAEYKNEILEQISRLPVYQRSMDTVLRLLSDRIHASLIIADNTGLPLNSVFWPRTLNFNVEKFLSSQSIIAEALALQGSTSAENPDEVILDGQSYYVKRLSLQSTSGESLWAYLIKEDAAISKEDAQQIAEVLQLFISVWSQSRSENALPELVQAILQDEPYKMRRIADIFNIDVASIHNMWLVDLIEQEGAPPSRIYRQEALHNILTLLKDELSHNFKTTVIDVIDDTVVALLDEPHNRDILMSLANDLAARLENEGYTARLTVCINLVDTAQCRRAWLESREALPTAMALFPLARVFTLQQISFALECNRILNQGEQAVLLKTSLLELFEEEKRIDFTETLMVYLLDANSSIKETARLLFVHPNTVKYRLQRISELLCGDIMQMPMYMELYRAVALQRLLGISR